MNIYENFLTYETFVPKFNKFINLKIHKQSEKMKQISDVVKSFITIIVLYYDVLQSSHPSKHSVKVWEGARDVWEKCHAFDPPTVV